MEIYLLRIRIAQFYQQIHSDRIITWLVFIMVLSIMYHHEASTLAKSFDNTYELHGF